MFAIFHILAESKYAGTCRDTASVRSVVKLFDRGLSQCALDVIGKNEAATHVHDSIPEKRAAESPAKGVLPLPYRYSRLATWKWLSESA